MAQQYFGYQNYEQQDLPEFPFNSYAAYELDWPWISYKTVVGTDVVSYYVNLLIMQYHNKPKARSTIAALVSPVIMDQVPQQVEDAFNLPGAVGVQLDTVGKYAGVTRSGLGPAAVPIILDDADFTRLIQAAIVRNTSTASLARIQALLHQYFPNEIFVFDHLTMRLSYYVNSTSVDLDLATLFVTKGLLPRPLGVGISSVIYAPLVILTTFFGLRTYEAPAPAGVSPLNNYTSYHTDYPFLTYSDRLIP